MNPNRRRQPGMGLMLLFYQLFGVIGIDKIPPVTLGTIGLQVAVFLRLFKLPWYKPTQVCVSAYKVWTKKEYSRLVYAAFEHGDDWHLYYNMLSFAFKGQSLERRFGSVKFAYIIGVFTILTNAVLVALNIFATDYLDLGFADQCAVGFSGVIFALKVLTTYYDSNYTHQIMGIPIMVPTRYAVWIELVLIQLFVPNASFTGHLAGILVGMAYVKGPLKFFMDLLYNFVKAVAFPSASTSRFTPHAGTSGYASNQSYASGSSYGTGPGYASGSSYGTGPGYASGSSYGTGPFYASGKNYATGTSKASSRGSYTDYVPEGMSEEEQLRRAMEESMREDSPPRHNVPPYPTSFSRSPPPPPGFVFGDGAHSGPSAPPPGFAPDIDELRSRRAARFTTH